MESLYSEGSKNIPNSSSDVGNEKESSMGGREDLMLEK